ncbi:hypothetical protein WBG78_03275 [Chryseolinea sp. T2]|uniref:hypothetical protein n=1 Tax=Chryseolinea sp. T2 TaxID=3129255 RepID=UPI003076F438
MKFEEIKTIWDTQNSKPMYTLNESLLYQQVIDRQRRVKHFARVSELLLILVNLGSAIFILGATLGTSNNLSLLVLSAWLLISGAWILYQRYRRLKGDDNFDRSIQGEVTYALSIANYQVRLARLGRWNVVPMGVLTLLALWESGKSSWWLIAIILLFVLSYIAAGWENSIYIDRRDELESLKKKIDDEVR